MYQRSEHGKSKDTEEIHSRIKASTASKRKAEIRKRLEGKVKGKAQYKPLAGDTVGKKNLKPSKHTLALKDLRAKIAEQSTKLKGDQQSRFISATSKVTGIPKSIIDEVYRKGMQAWASGHRPALPSLSGHERGFIAF